MLTTFTCPCCLLKNLLAWIIPLKLFQTLDLCIWWQKGLHCITQYLLQWMSMARLLNGSLQVVPWSLDEVKPQLQSLQEHMTLSCLPPFNVFVDTRSQRNKLQEGFGDATVRLDIFHAVQSITQKITKTPPLLFRMHEWLKNGLSFSNRHRQTKKAEYPLPCNHYGKAWRLYVSYIDGKYSVMLPWMRLHPWKCTLEKEH